jgi:hypothetical protein
MWCRTGRFRPSSCTPTRLASFSRLTSSGDWGRARRAGGTCAGRVRRAVREGGGGGGGAGRRGGEEGLAPEPAGGAYTVHCAYHGALWDEDRRGEFQLIELEELLHEIGQKLACVGAESQRRGERRRNYSEGVVPTAAQRALFAAHDGARATFFSVADELDICVRDMHAGVALLFVDSCEDGSAELGLKDRQQGMHAVSSGEQHASALHEACVRTLMFPSTPLDSRVCATTSVR